MCLEGVGDAHVVGLYTLYGVIHVEGEVGCGLGVGHGSDGNLGTLHGVGKYVVFDDILGVEGSGVLLPYTLRGAGSIGKVELLAILNAFG